MLPPTPTLFEYIFACYTLTSTPLLLRSSMINLMLFAFILYFSLLINIGIYFYNKNKKQSDFSLANRSLNYWVTAISAQASDMSDWLFMAYPGAVFAIGISQVWIAIGLCFFMFLTWHFIAPKIRVETEKYNALTLSTFFEKKFNDSTHNIRIISGIFCLYFFIFYIAAGLVGLGKVFELAFEIDYSTGIILGLSLSVVYTLLGGLLAIAWSDFFQGMFLLGCIILVPWYATNSLGGFEHLYDSLQIFSSQYRSVWPAEGVVATIFAILSWGIGYFGQPHILINFMGINNPKDLAKSKVVGSSWQIIALISAIFVGLVGKVMLFGTIADPELVFIVMVKQLFSPFIAGFILCAILAATISTMNTQALISSSLITQDLLFPVIKTKLTEQQKVMYTRLATLIIPALSLIVAYQSRVSILKLVLYAWSGLGSCFGPIVILSLYSTILNRYGVLAGLLSGGATAMIWPFIPSSIPTLVAGFLINGTIATIVSKKTNT